MSLRALLSAKGSSASWCGEEILEIFDRLDPPRPAAHDFHNLVTRNRIHPRREPLAGIPGMALEVDRQRGLLHCIPDIRAAHSGARERGAPSCTERPSSSSSRRYAPSSPAIEALIF